MSDKLHGALTRSDRFPDSSLKKEFAGNLAVTRASSLRGGAAVASNVSK